MSTAALVTVDSPLAKLTPEQLAYLIDKHFPTLGLQYDAERRMYLAPSKHQRVVWYQVRCVRENGIIRHVCSCAAPERLGLCTHLHVFARRVGPLDQQAPGEDIHEIDREDVDRRHPGLFRATYRGQRVA